MKEDQEKQIQVQEMENEQIIAKNFLIFEKCFQSNRRWEYLACSDWYVIFNFSFLGCFSSQIGFRSTFQHINIAVGKFLRYLQIQQNFNNLLILILF
jgi:hypothetical protein